MSDASQPFAFSQFVPGFDFLKNLSGASAAPSAVPGLPSLASWVAPTLSVEEVDKRIQELKTVQYWLEQNGHALKATIQALEVQKMTLSTLRGMNVRMEDLASAFTRAATAAPAAADEAEPEPARPEPEPEPTREAAAEAATPASGAAQAPGIVDPLQWWGALTQQFQQIAGAALQDAAQLKMPAMPQGGPGATPGKPDAKAPTGARTRAAAGGGKPAPARAAAKGAAPARKRTSKDRP